MRHLYIALVFVGLLGSTTAFAADPAGRYQVEGGNPGNSGAYHGVVTVQKTGQTYRVIWVIGSTRFVGTGIGTNDFFSVAYAAPGKGFGLALYRPNGSDWAGVWTLAGGQTVGWETWKRQ